MQTDSPLPSYAGHPQRWAERFEFFDAHGVPGSPSYKEAFKKLTFMQRIKIGSNLPAFFFGPIYFLVIGLRRTAIATFGFACALIIVAVMADLLIPNARVADMIGRMAGLLVALVCAQVANYAYYRKEAKREEERWNFFKLIRWI